MRQSSDIYNKEGRLMEGYDYDNQAWVKNGKYIRCAHSYFHNCKCYGKINEGRETIAKGE